MAQRKTTRRSTQPTLQAAARKASKRTAKRTAKKKPTPKRKHPTKAQRLEIIIDRMVNCTWVKRKTARELAKKWGMHVDTVERDSAEASRTLRSDPKEREDRKGVWLAKIGNQQVQASKAGDYNATARLLELEGKGEGFLEPVKFEGEISGLAGLMGAALKQKQGTAKPSDSDDSDDD